MVESAIRPYAAAVEKHALANPDVLCLSADLTSSCEIDGFRDRHPDKFISLGMAEQNMMSFAGGLGLAGFRPFVHTFGVFLYRRPYDQLMASIAYPRRRVRLMGFLPRIFSTPMQVGKMRELGSGEDILIVTSGIATEEALRARGALEAAGVSVRHLHISTIKSFNDADLLDHVCAVKHGVVTMENHVTTGGIGSLVAEIMAESGTGRRLVRLGLQDTYAHGGSRPYLMRYYGLDAVALVKGVESLLGQKFGITEQDLDAVRVDSVHSAAKAEAL